MYRMFSKTPLRLILIFPFVVQITAAVGLTAWLSIRNGQQAVNKVAGQLREETTARINVEINHLLSTARAVNDLSVKTIHRENLDLGNIRSVEAAYWDYFNTFPEILGVGLGNAAGDILGMFRRIESDETLYFLEYSSPETGGRYVSIQLNPQGQAIQSEITDQSIDARERPWYQAAVEAAGPVWTEVYTSISQVEGHALAINASQPIYTSDGQLRGVASVILDLGQISQLLEAIELSPSGQIYILESNGSLIGNSDGNNPVSAHGNRIDRLPATESKNQLVRASAAYLSSLFEGNLGQVNQALQLDFDLAGERQYLQITPIQSGSQLQWFIVVVVPESDFMGQINTNTRNTILLCIVALGLTTGFSVLTAHWVTHVLQQLNQATKDIAEGNLQPEDHWDNITTSRIQEVNDLAHSFLQMAQQLNTSFAALRTSEANFRNMAANVPGAILRYILRPDGTDSVLYMSPGCYRLWEIEADAVEQNASILWEMVDPEDLPTLQALMMKSARTLETWYCEWRIITPSGSPKWLQGKGRPIRQPDGTVLWHIVILDVSDRKQAEIQLQDLTNRLELAARSANLGIWEWDVVNDRLIWDDRMYELYGLNPEDFGEAYSAWETGVHPDDQSASRLAIQHALKGEKDFNTEFRVLWPNGTVRHIEAHAMVQRDEAGRPLRMIGVNLDISDRKQAEEQLIHSALHDSLTGLPNRALLTNRLESAMQRSQRSTTYHFAVLFLDLDQFKVINDSLGHQVGDELLLSVAQKLRRIIRPTDLAARLGGDEFVILLEHVPTIEAVIHMAERLLSEFDHVTLIDSHSVFISTSIGIVWGSSAYTKAADLLRDADIALYRAKAQGRRRYEIFDVEMHAQAMKRMTLEHDLRVAIDRQEFVTYYQPIVDLNTLRLLGFEALIRWQHPTRGFISPTDFIPVAEETGLIVPITRWVLQSACEQLVTWQQQCPHLKDLRVSVNLSSQDLRQTHLVESIEKILTQTQLSAHSLTLEITESMLVENTEDAISLLGQLRDLGIRFSIDDFGTGYSSLSYLYNLPADYLKIDQSFVSHMEPGNKNYKIVQAVVSLSDQLQLAAIAEGVETEQQLAWLKEFGCELGQGYLLARPLAPEAATDLLAIGQTLQR